MNTEAVKKLNGEPGQERPEHDYPWIVFAVNGTEYGINSRYVLSIEILKKVTPIVDAPHYCPGITESRGELIDLLDLRALFGLENYLSTKSDRQDKRFMMVVIEMDNVKRGMIVDEIVSVEYIVNFVEGIGGESDGSKPNGSATSRYIRQIARREKIDTPVLIISQESLSEL